VAVQHVVDDGGQQVGGSLDCRAVAEPEQALVERLDPGGTAAGSATLAPNVGPIADSRSVTTDRWPSRASPIARPMDVTVLPMPAVVGVVAVTRT
jgi:hypothetical protein